MSNYMFDNFKMVLVEDNSKVIDNNNSLCDFYNAEGGLLILKGVTVPSRLVTSKIYISREDYDRLIGFNSNKIDFTINESEPGKAKDDPSINATIERKLDNVISEKRKKEIRTKYGEKVFTTCNRAIDNIKDILKPGEVITQKKIEATEEIVDETQSLDMAALNGCISELRTADDYTYHHSFGVYLLMNRCLEYFKKQAYEEDFYDSFKSINQNVNFNTASIRKYCVAALLHDYGKIRIPKEVIQKKGKLTDDEYELIKCHPKIAVKDLYALGMRDPAMIDPAMIDIVGNHHFRYLALPKMGQGPLAQICNIVDVYEACRANRTYKGKEAFDETIKILVNEKLASDWNDYIFESIIKRILPDFEKSKF